MNIIEALKTLDPLNDDHWTGEGDPRMSVVEDLVGSTSITRDNVTNAAPRFCRTNLECPGDKPKIEAVKEEVKEEVKIEAAPEVTEIEQITDELEEVSKEVDDLSAQKVILDKKFADAQYRQGKLASAKTERTATDDQIGRMNYIKSQNEQRKLRAEKSKDLAIKLGVINGQKPMSPLDTSLKNRPKQQMQNRPSR